MKANNTDGHEEQRLLACSWLESVGIDPHTVPIDGLTWTKGGRLVVERYPMDPSGRHGPRERGWTFDAKDVPVALGGDAA